jgi:NADPH-dependent 2,4-dienoyl-CoA reductase/sulfur reductase-like enzyme
MALASGLRVATVGQARFGARNTGKGTSMPRVLVAGGSDTGIGAALRAREIDPGMEAPVALEDRFPSFSFSACGLPFFIAGRWVRRLPGHTVTGLDPAARRAMRRREDGQPVVAPYDRLVIATGARASRPSLAGLDLPGVLTLRSMGDGLAIDAYTRDAGPTAAVIVGGSYIGREMAEALRRRGLAVTLMEGLPTVMASPDRQLATEVGPRRRADAISYAGLA